LSTFAQQQQEETGVVLMSSFGSSRSSGAKTLTIDEKLKKNKSILDETKRIHAETIALKDELLRAPEELLARELKLSGQEAALLTLKESLEKKEAFINELEATLALRKELSVLSPNREEKLLSEEPVNHGTEFLESEQKTTQVLEKSTHGIDEDKMKSEAEFALVKEELQRALLFQEELLACTDLLRAELAEIKEYSATERAVWSNGGSSEGIANGPDRESAQSDALETQRLAFEARHESVLSELALCEVFIFVIPHKSSRIYLFYV
jgi:hypothetical protein